jgi:putative transposase
VRCGTGCDPRRRPQSWKLPCSSPILSPRELACHITDHAGFTVSEATVYRVLKRYVLNRTIALVSSPASKEFRVKTTAPNQICQSDASYYLVVGWGWVLLDRSAG